MGFFDWVDDSDNVRKLRNKDEYREEFADDASMTLRKEDLDIAKDRMRAGEVAMSKDIVEEHKIVDVPVSHEEVVIERKAFNEQSDRAIDPKDHDMIHIPLSKEEVRVGKHTEVIGEVTAHKRAVEETRHVDEVLMREEGHVDYDGDPRFISKGKGSRH